MEFVKPVHFLVQSEFPFDTESQTLLHHTAR